MSIHAKSIGRAMRTFVAVLFLAGMAMRWRLRCARKPEPWRVWRAQMARCKFLKGFRMPRHRLVRCAGKSRNLRSSLARRAQSDGVRRALHARQCVWRYGVPRCSPERRLFVFECVDAKGFARCQAARDGLDLRRRLSGRRHFRAAARWRASGAQRRGGCEHELPAGNFWIFLASRADQGIAASRIGKLRFAGSSCRIAMGSQKHRRVRW